MDRLTVVGSTIKYLFTVRIGVVGELSAVPIPFILTRYSIYLDTPARKRLGGPRGGPPFTFTESVCRIGGRRVIPSGQPRSMVGVNL